MYPYGWSDGETPRNKLEFRDFQDLPALVQRGLAWGIKEMRQGNTVATEHIARWIVNRYVSFDETETIGTYMGLLDIFLVHKRGLAIVSCYVDHDCDMMLTKLAWSDDYKAVEREL